MSASELQTRIDAAVAYLREHGKAIGSAAGLGDSLSLRIIDAYKMVHACPEPGALVMLEEAIKARVERMARRNEEAAT